MSLRPPSSLSPGRSGTLSALDYELAAEKAEALARAGRRVEAALEALAEARSQARDIDGLLNDAADAVFALFIQRELCGMRDQADTIRRYAISKDVVARLGVVRR